MLITIRRAASQDGDQRSRKGLPYAWVNAVWTPRFTHFMHAYLQDVGSCGGVGGGILRRKRDTGKRWRGDWGRFVAFPEGSFMDIGTPENLRVRSEDSPMSDDVSSRVEFDESSRGPAKGVARVAIII